MASPYQTAFHETDADIWIRHIAPPFNDQRWSSVTLAEEGALSDYSDDDELFEPSEPPVKPPGPPGGPPGFQGGKPGGKPDPNAVDWEGPKDPDNPINYNTYYKMWVTFCLSMLSLAATLGSSIVAPAEYILSNYFGISQELVVLGVSLYM